MCAERADDQRGKRIERHEAANYARRAPRRGARWCVSGTQFLTRARAIFGFGCGLVDGFGFAPPHEQFFSDVVSRQLVRSLLASMTVVDVDKSCSSVSTTSKSVFRIV